MKLLIATPLYPPDIGGPATHSASLVQELPSVGIEVSVLSFAEVRHHMPGVRHAIYAYRLARLARRADVILAQDTVSVGFPALLASWLTRKPLMVRVPGDHAWEQGRQRFGVADSLDEFQHKRYGLRVEFLRAIARLVVRGADRVIAPSDYFYRIVGGWMKDTSRLKVIYNGVDFATVPEAPAAAPAHPFMVSVGRFVPWKGFGVLIDLLPALPGWSLVLLGDGPLRSELAARAQEKGVADRVVFTGSVPRGEVLGWYKDADAFVLNSSFESFSYQVAEALYAGVPVIATNIGSIPELVEDGVEGVLVRPDDREALGNALKSISSEPEAWKARVAAGKRKAERFSAALTARQFGEEIRAVAGARMVRP